MANNATGKIESQCYSKLCYETNGMKNKAENVDEIMSLIKKKFYVLTKELWHPQVQKVQNNFAVTEYQAKIARQIFNKKGLLAVV